MPITLEDEAQLALQNSPLDPTAGRRLARDAYNPFRGYEQLFVFYDRGDGDGYDPVSGTAERPPVEHKVPGVFLSVNKVNDAPGLAQAMFLSYRDMTLKEQTLGWENFITAFPFGQDGNDWQYPLANQTMLTNIDYADFGGREWDVTGWAILASGFIARVYFNPRGFGGRIE